jgi:imidazolonepropionase-like amidohydrolase
VCLAWAQTPPSADGFVLKGGTVHTISGAVIENGSVLVRGGKIVGVGKNLTPPKGYQVIDISGQHVYPGMIDAASMIGLEKSSEALPSDAEEIGLLNPQLRAATAVNPDSPVIPMTRANGVTSAIVMPEGDLLAGQMSMIHLDGSNNDAMTVAPATSVYLRFPAITTVPLRPHEPSEEDEDPMTDATPEPIPYEQAKHDYDEKMQALRGFFDEARQYRKAKQAKSRDFRTNLKYEAMLPVLEGATPMFVTAVRERTIREAIAFAVEQKVKIILADAYEAYKVLPLIKQHNIAVILGPTFSYPLDRDEAYDRNYTTAGDLYKAGIKFAIGTFSSMASRNLPYQAAAAVPYGLPPDAAYKTVSLNAAEIFGLGKKLGSIDEGKSADLIVSDGDPLDVRTTIKMVFIDGKPADLETRQKLLYEKYTGKK